MGSLWNRVSFTNEAYSGTKIYVRCVGWTGRVQPLNYVISSVDRDSIEKSEQERHTGILDEVNDKLQESLIRNANIVQQEIASELQNPQQQLSNQRRTFADRVIEKIEEDYERNWKSSIEIACPAYGGVPKSRE